MSIPAIDMQNVHKSYRKNVVLRDLTLQVDRGRTFAFLGRNGAGKTTTIQMLLGLLKQDSGSIRVLGDDPTKSPLQVRSKVGYLAEDQQMYGWMKCGNLLRFMAPFYPTWDHQLALKFANDFEVPLSTRVKHLSKGQNVRLGLVLALAHRPELVILDDPSLGLDPIMRKQFNRDLITHLQGEGRTVFYSSHLLNEVESVADNVAILRDGKIVRCDETEVLREDVKRFVVGADYLQALQDNCHLLDVQRDNTEVAVVAEKANAGRRILLSQHAEFREIDLNLDEIFEAYVNGSPNGLTKCDVKSKTVSHTS